MSPPEDVLARAEAGDAGAANALGLWYDECRPDSADAEIWFRRAAEAGMARAQHNMGVIASRAGRAVEAAGWFRTAMDGGWRNSCAALGVVLQQLGQEERAFEAFEHGARLGCANCQDLLGYHAFEEETEDGYQRARYWLELAAEQGHPGAQTRLATIHHEGLGIPRDPQLAAYWFEEAARRGHPGAQAMIGVAYQVGAGVPIDRVKAVRWLRASAAQGHKIGCLCLPDAERDLTPADREILKRESR